MPRTRPDTVLDDDNHDNDDGYDGAGEAVDWQRRVVGRSLRTATKRSIDRGHSLIRAAAAILDRTNGEGFTVQEVADEAGQSLRTLYQYFESKDDLLLAVFEEAMRTYARLIGDAIVDLTDPLERLAGAMITAVRLPEFSGSGVDRGLARLRLKLGEVDPQLVARSQQPVTSLVRDLIAKAADAGQIDTDDLDGAAYMVLALKSSFNTNQTLGNDSGVRLPTASRLTAFCLAGLGASFDHDRLDAVNDKLHLPERALSMDPRPRAKRAPSSNQQA